jgi:hypothetical protein
MLKLHYITSQALIKGLLKALKVNYLAAGLIVSGVSSHADMKTAKRIAVSKLPQRRWCGKAAPYRA